MLPMLFYQLGFLSSHFLQFFLLLLLFFWHIDVFPLSFHLESLYPYHQNQSGLLRVSTAGIVNFEFKAVLLPQPLEC